jgi:hypothetical protein
VRSGEEGDRRRTEFSDRRRRRPRLGIGSGACTELARNHPWSLRVESTTAQPSIARRSINCAAVSAHTVDRLQLVAKDGKDPSLLFVLASASCSTLWIGSGVLERLLGATPAMEPP